MFFILNNEKAILAADKSFLESVGAPSIYLLAELFRSHDFHIDESNHTYQIGGVTRFFTRSALQTIFGSGYLYRIEEDVTSQGLTVPPSTEHTKTDTITSALMEETAPPPEEFFSSTETTVKDDLPVTLAPSMLEESAATPHHELSDLSLSDLPEPDTDILETKSDHPSFKASDVPSLHEDDLLDLLDLEEKVPSEKTALEPESSSKLEAEVLEDILADQLDLGKTSDQTEETFGLDLPTASAAIAGAGAGAAMLANELLSPAKKSPEDTEIFDLLDAEHAAPSSDTTHSTLLHKDVSAQMESNLPDTPFSDYHSHAQIIGITPEEYTGFLQRFTEESLGYEASLKSNDLPVFKKNLTSIKDAAQLLHLSQLSETINELEKATSNERHALVDTLFTMIRHIRRDLEAEQPHDKNLSGFEAKIPDAKPKPAVNLSASDSDLHAGSLATLANVEAIPFDFSTKAASDELGLPEALVREFVSDFVIQAEENIAVFHEAQHLGDIDTIQKTAHLLKGAASNLRIDPLADTLKELQFNEEIQKVPDIFKRFVGQLKSLINFTNLTDK